MSGLLPQPEEGGGAGRRGFALEHDEDSWLTLAVGLEVDPGDDGSDPLGADEASASEAAPSWLFLALPSGRSFAALVDPGERIAVQALHARSDEGELVLPQEVPFLDVATLDELWRALARELGPRAEIHALELGLEHGLKLRSERPGSVRLEGRGLGLFAPRLARLTGDEPAHWERVLRALVREALTSTYLRLRRSGPDSVEVHALPGPLSPGAPTGLLARLDVGPAEEPRD